MIVTVRPTHLTLETKSVADIAFYKPSQSENKVTNVLHCQSISGASAHSVCVI